MNDEGVLLVSGTNLTNEWIAPGEGLHQEFELLAEAGLSPNQILRMTGANAAEALHRNDVGIIEAGRRADLVLLSADPQVDLEHPVDRVGHAGRSHNVPRRTQTMTGLYEAAYPVQLPDWERPAGRSGHSIGMVDRVWKGVPYVRSQGILGVYGTPVIHTWPDI